MKTYFNFKHKFIVIFFSISLYIKLILAQGTDFFSSEPEKKIIPKPKKIVEPKSVKKISKKIEVIEKKKIKKLKSNSDVIFLFDTSGSMDAFIKKKK